MAISELADWWDKQKRASEAILTEWVQENPQWWAIAVAGTVQTSMDLGQGLVDVLRFGEGAAEGGIKGYGKDALRLLVLLGPLARAGGMASRLINASQVGRLRLAVQVAGVDGPCTFQAVNNALSIVKGKNLFLTVEDMAAATGRAVKSLTQTKSGLYQLGAWIDELVPTIRKFTMVREVKGLKNLSEVLDVARRVTGVTIFAIRATVKAAGGATEELLHSVIAVSKQAGKLQFADYGGKLVGSLEELVGNLGYGQPVATELLQSGSSATIVGGSRITGEIAAALSKGVVLVIEGLTAIDTDQHGTQLAVPVAVVATNAPAKDESAPADLIKGSFEAFKARKAGKPVIRLPEVVIKAGRSTAPRSDWLTGVQFRLNALGFGAGPVDGIKGPKTDRAIRKFQQTYPPLRVDGVPGPKTQAKLVEVCGY
jgi:hypothetical protein